MDKTNISSKYRMLYNIFKILTFFVVGLLLFCFIQHIMSNKWLYPQDYEEHYNSFREFQNIELDETIQAVFLGTSHSRCAVDPMMIYRNYQIATYNLSTSGQPIEGSYYILKWIVSIYHPKIVFLDASSLFTPETDDASHLRIIENLPQSKEKWEYARTYSLLRSGETKLINRFIEGIIPLVVYHNRWKELRDYDFSFDQYRANLFLKGYYWANSINGTSLSVEEMNNEASINESGKTNSLVDGESSFEVIDAPLYAPFIHEKNAKYVKMMKQLCDDAGIEFVLFKVPAIGNPQYLSGAWTRIKSNIAKEYAANNSISFIDLLYDYDVGINWLTDTVDWGNHLNHQGAEKISSFLGQYMMNNYNLEPAINKTYEDDLEIYSAVQKVSIIQSTQHLSQYIESLNKCDKITIILAACDDMRYSLDSASIEALELLDLQTDFDRMEFRDSYIAVINNKDVEYESTSNRKIEYSTLIGSNISCYVSSGGWYAGREAKILINGVDVSLGLIGINIVVIDNETCKVIDSVNFNTFLESDPIGTHDIYGNIDRFLLYEKNLMKQEYIQGIR